MGVIIMMMARNCTPSACSGVQLPHIENIERVQLPCIEMRLDRAFDGEELYSEPRFGSATPSHRRERNSLTSSREHRVEAQRPEAFGSRREGSGLACLGDEKQTLCNRVVMFSL